MSYGTNNIIISGQYIIQWGMVLIQATNSFEAIKKLQRQRFQNSHSLPSGYTRLQQDKFYMRPKTDAICIKGRFHSCPSGNGSTKPKIGFLTQLIATGVSFQIIMSLNFLNFATGADRIEKQKAVAFALIGLKSEQKFSIHLISLSLIRLVYVNFPTSINTN